MSRICIISQIYRNSFFSYATRNHHRLRQKLSPSVSLSITLRHGYSSIPMLYLSHKLLNFTPFSLYNLSPQMGSANLTLIHSNCYKSGDAFDQTVGGHVSISSDQLYEKDGDYGFTSDLSDQTLPGHVSITSNSDELNGKDGDHGSITHPFDQTTNGCVSISSNSEKLYKIITDCKPNNPENSNMERSLDQAGIQLTTPLVMECLGSLRFEEKLAFRFFTWAGNQENYNHEPEAYNEMIDILSNTKYKANQFRIVCDLLDYMKRKNKTRVPIEDLLKILKQYADKHLTHLHKFAKKKNVKFKKMQPEIDALNVLLDAFCKCCLVEDAEAMFMKIKSKVKPNANAYNILFFGWCRVRNPSRSMQILDEMIEMGHTPENFTYNTAIDTFCRAGMVTEAAELLEFMRGKGTTMSAPTAKTYAIMIVALARSNRMEESSKLVEEMVNSGCLPDVSTYKEMIEGMCLTGKVKSAYKFLEDMGNKGYPCDIVTYNCFLKVLCDSKDSEEALRLYNKMIEVGCVPSVQTFNILMTMFFKIGDSNGAFEIWREMDKRGCFHDTDSYCIMIEGLFGCERKEDACALLEDVVNKGMKLPYQKFDSFLMQLSRLGDLRAIHRLSDHMRKFYNPAMARRFALNQKRKSVSLRGK